MATKQMINHNFVVSKNREYHLAYQANVSQFWFESASGRDCGIRSDSRQFPVSLVVSSQHVGEPMSSAAARLYRLSVRTPPMSLSSTRCRWHVEIPRDW